MKRRYEQQTTPTGTIGLTQLSLVEHSLCPLDARSSLKAGYCHETSYRYTDQAGERQTSRVRITCLDGLSANDEFYLWGLMALALAQPEASAEFQATPHYCLSRLGVVTKGSRGGKTYRLFRESLSRLSGVRYENEKFYDPIRKEHRRVRFGLLGYSLPLDEQSNRAWRIVWDTQFFEFCRATSGALRFDLELYRQLDPASRRLFLLLQKVFYRRKVSPRFAVSELAVSVLGFSESLPVRKLRAKVKRCGEILADLGVLGEQPAFGGRNEAGFVRFTRGAKTTRAWRCTASFDSPLADQLAQLGLDEASASWVLRGFPKRLVTTWCDVTQAAIEHRGRDFFRRNPAAFLIDNLKAAKRGERTPPDWFLAIQKSEQRRLAEIARPREPGERRTPERALPAGLGDRELVSAMVAQFRAAGQSPAKAKENAERLATANRSASRLPNARRR